jgi:hypothetical protein
MGGRADPWRCDRRASHGLSGWCFVSARRAGSGRRWRSCCARRRRGLVRHNAREVLAALLALSLERGLGFSLEIRRLSRSLFGHGSENAAFPQRGCMRPILFFAFGLFFALSAADASAAASAPSSAATAIASDKDQSLVVQDLGPLPPPAGSDNPTATPSSVSTVASAEPVPELPTWAMMLLCLLGLGFAGFKTGKGRKNRLSPGID